MGASQSALNGLDGDTCDVFKQQLKQGWVEQIIDKYVQLTNGHFGGLSREMQIKSILDHFLATDAASSLRGVLPDLEGKTTLEGNFLVQIEEVVDISRSIKERYVDHSPGPTRHLNFHLTDGRRLYVGMEYKHLSNVPTIPPRGAKALLKGPIPISRCRLMLSTQNFVYLGGSVAELDEQQKALLELVRQQPVGQTCPQPTLAEFMSHICHKIIESTQPGGANSGEPSTRHQGAGPVQPPSPQQEPGAAPVVPAASPLHHSTLLQQHQGDNPAARGPVPETQQHTRTLSAAQQQLQTRQCQAAAAAAFQTGTAAPPQLLGMPTQYAQQQAPHGSISFGSGRVPSLHAAATRDSTQQHQHRSEQRNNNVGNTHSNTGDGDGGGGNGGANVEASITEEHGWGSSSDEEGDAPGPSGAAIPGAGTAVLRGGERGQFDSAREGAVEEPEVINLVDTDDEEYQPVQEERQNHAAPGEVLKNHAVNEDEQGRDQVPATRHLPNEGDAEGGGGGDQMEIDVIENNDETSAKRARRVTAGVALGSPIEDSSQDTKATRAISYQSPVSGSAKRKPGSGSARGRGGESGSARRSGGNKKRLATRSSSPLVLSRDPMITVNAGGAAIGGFGEVIVAGRRLSAHNNAGAPGDVGAAGGVTMHTSSTSTLHTVHNPATGALAVKSAERESITVSPVIRTSRALNFNNTDAVTNGGGANGNAAPCSSEGNGVPRQRFLPVADELMQPPVGLEALRNNLSTRHVAPPVALQPTEVVPQPQRGVQQPVEWGSQGPQPFTTLYTLYRHLQSVINAEAAGTVSAREHSAYPISAAIMGSTSNFSLSNETNSATDAKKQLTVVIEDPTGICSAVLSPNCLIDMINGELLKQGARLHLETLSQLRSLKNESIVKEAFHRVQKLFKEFYGIIEVSVAGPDERIVIVQLLDAELSQSGMPEEVKEEHVELA